MVFYFLGRMMGVGIVGGFTILFINLWGNVFLGLFFFQPTNQILGGKVLKNNQ